MKDFVDWEKFNHAILNDIEVLLYERAVAVSDSDILQADRIKEVILENMNILSDASDIWKGDWKGEKSYNLDITSF